MRHRHLNHDEYTLAAIDSVIERGSPDDWRELREAALARPALIPMIARVCEAQRGNPYTGDLHEDWLAWLRTLPTLAHSPQPPD